MYNDYNNDRFQTSQTNPANPAEQTSSLTAQDINRYMAKVYGWMFFGLVITAVFCFLMQTMLPANRASAMQTYGVITLVCFIGQMFIVFRLSRGLQKLSAPSATVMFIIFSALNGVWLSYVFLIYASAQIVVAFAMCAVMFGVMSLFGLATKQDLTSFGRLAMVGLIGIIVVSLINMFIGSSGLDFLVCIIGLVIFLGLTAYDAQKIRGMYMHIAPQGDQIVAVSAIQGALSLYLDFINIFLFILRLLGRRS